MADRAGTTWLHTTRTAPAAMILMMFSMARSPFAVVDDHSLKQTSKAEPLQNDYVEYCYA
ncbi:hypothetical protein Mnod_8745 (plasmid) [Methylobacterium nodulans ORS 2060]|uniref:Uncharacterized protein n=1 Tax=Methylobacterium nodulans (strain LMG 21967 / CNCM I-2342 / ORS 2060) TaxID=460265 RepID=B8IWL0_METNO|nr:hypothetical protein Mnod_8745 [Methylobacterium nodulans ORS 2060]